MILQRQQHTSQSQSDDPQDPSEASTDDGTNSKSSTRSEDTAPSESTSASSTAVTATASIPILIEIVSAQLNSENEEHPHQFNTYCIIKDLSCNNVGYGSTTRGSINSSTAGAGAADDNNDAPRIIHKTKVVRKTDEPIWTVLTDSLHLIHATPSELNIENENENENEGKIRIELYHKDLLQLMHHYLGSVLLRKLDLYKGDGGRIEFTLRRNPEGPATKTGIAAPKSRRNVISRRRQSLMHQREHYFSLGTLALRFRPARPHEIKFMEAKALSATSPGFKKNPLRIFSFTAQNDSSRGPSTGTGTGARDRTFRRQFQSNIVLVSPTSVGKKMQDMYTFVQKGKYRVKPYPDPQDPGATTWLDKQELNHQALEPSRNWVQSCNKVKDLGTLYVEIIQCRHLPNLDSGAMGDVTDPFVAMVFEDNIVRTDVIRDELSPSFMPWTQRAFAFSIQHPSSLLFLGVFDDDAIGNHEPIGRVVVDLSNFKGNTVYLLDYKLNSNPDKEGDGGVLTIRVRVEWHSETKAMLKTFRSPPQIRVNVSNHKAFRLVRYLCRGKVSEHDTDGKSTMARIALKILNIAY